VEELLAPETMSCNSFVSWSLNLNNKKILKNVIICKNLMHVNSYLLYKNLVGPYFESCQFTTLPYICSVINHRWPLPKCGKKKKVAYEVIAECVTDVLTMFMTYSMIS